MKREVSLGVGLATAALVWGVYNSALPSLAEMRVSPPADPHADVTERTATWTATAIVAGISLIAKDPTVFVIGGSMVVALAWWHRHANQLNPATRTVTASSSRGIAPGTPATAGAGYMPGS